MTEYSIFAENFLIDGVWQNNLLVHIKSGRIADISKTDSAHADYRVCYLTPGLIDNHIHGGDGFSVVKPDAASLIQWLERLAVNGVCGIMLAPYGSMDTIRAGLAVIREVMRLQQEGEISGALLLGAHLEGPFISKKRPGAMTEDTILPSSIEKYTRMVSGYEDVIREITLAPETDGAAELIDHLTAQGIRVLAGHTDCGYEQAKQAFAAGVGAICHTFNASIPIHHREPGIITAALTSPQIYCEAICDLEHLHPGILRLIMSCKGKDRFMVISDAVSTTNLPDGLYTEGDVVVEVKNGVSRHRDLGCLNGGGCYLSKSVQNLTAIGIPFENAVAAASTTPARWLGLDILPKAENAVFLEGWNEHYVPQYTFINGIICPCRHI